MRLPLILSALLSCTAFSREGVTIEGPLSLKSYFTKPKLIVVIVIDQFRADYLTRFEKRFAATTGKSAPGGFRYLMAPPRLLLHAPALRPSTSPAPSLLLSGFRYNQLHADLQRIPPQAKGPPTGRNRPGNALPALPQRKTGASNRETSRRRNGPGLDRIFRRPHDPPDPRRQAEPLHLQAADSHHHGDLKTRNSPQSLRQPQRRRAGPRLMARVMARI